MKSLSSYKIWSAVPTPLNSDLTVDGDAVTRMVNAAIQDGIHGLFLAGTCGEGPWLPDRERRHLIEFAANAARGRLKIAAQVSDNSTPRILENIYSAAGAGADYAIIAAPALFMNATPARIAALFADTVNASPLPVGIYDLGSHRPITIPTERLSELYRLPNVHLVKDSSGSPERRAIALAAKEERSGLLLLNGDEFRCLDYLQAGYDGCMFGGAAAVAPQIHRIIQLFHRGQFSEAAAVDAEMKRQLYGIYGGEKIACWLTGLKYYMVQRGLFTSTASFLGYPLTDECRTFIENLVATQSASPA